MRGEMRNFISSHPRKKESEAELETGRCPVQNTCKSQIIPTVKTNIYMLVLRWHRVQTIAPEHFKATFNFSESFLK